MKQIITLILLFLFSFIIEAQTIYYSGVNEGWGGDDMADVNNWNDQLDGTGSPPADFTSNDQEFHVTNNDAMNLYGAFVISGTNAKLVVESGATANVGANNPNIPLELQSGGTYRTSASYTNLSIISISNTSDFILEGSAGVVRNNITYGNFILDGTGTTTISTTTGLTLNINGNLEIKGSRIFNCAGNIFTRIYVGGNAIVSGGTLRVANGNATPLLSITGNLNINSGTFVAKNANGGANIHVGLDINQSGGTCNLIAVTTTVGPVNINVNGSFIKTAGTYNAKSVSSTLYPIINMRVSGNLETNGFTNSDHIFNISGSYTINTPTFTIGRTLSITGGSITIGDKTLILNESVVLSSGTINGGSSANITFGNGVSTTIAGALPAVSGGLGTLTINRNATVTMIGDNTINNNLQLTNGTFAIGNYTLTLLLGISGTGSIVGGNLSNLVVNGGSGPASVNIPSLTLNNLTLNRENGATASGNITVLGTLLLNRGILSGGSNIYIGNNSTIARVSSSAGGYSTGSIVDIPNFLGNVNLLYMGSTGYTTGDEIPASQPNTIINTFTINQSGGSGITLNTSNIQINSTLSLAGTNSVLNGSTFNINVLGNIVNNGTFNANSGTVSCLGSTTLTGTNAITFNNLQINSAGTGLTLGASNTSVAGTLTFNTGNVTTGAHTLVISNGGATTGGSSSSYVIGNLRKRISTGASTTDFEIGTASQYAPVTVTFAGVSSAGYLTVRSDNGDNPDVGSSTFSTERVARYWTFTNAGVSPTNYDALFNYASGEATGTTSTYRVGVFSGGSWSYANAGTQNATQTSGLGFTAIGTYQIGNISTTTNTTWTGIVNTDWYNASNWSSGVPTLATDVLITTVSGANYPTITTTGALANNLTINANASLSFVGSQTLTVAGSFSNNGTFTPSSGTVTFTNTNAGINGSSSSVFYNLSLSNAAAYAVNQNIFLQNTLTLGTNAALNISIGGITLLSNSLTGTARLAAMPAGATISGNVTVQRYIPPSGRWQWQLCSPVSGATVADWQNTFYITGNFTGKSINTTVGINSTAAASMFYYNPIAGILDFYPTFGGSNLAPLVPGQGYRPFIRDGGVAYTVTGAKTITLTGTLNIGTFSFNSLMGYSTTGGWNFLGNPYACEILGDLTNATMWPSRTNVGNIIYSWNPETKTYKTFNGVTGSPSTYTGIIASGQGFWVQATAASPTLSVSESAKTIGGSSLYRTTNYPDHLVITLKAAALTNESSLIYYENSLKNKDNYDALKLELGSGQTGTSSYLIATLIDNKNTSLAIDSRPHIQAGMKDTVDINLISLNGKDTLLFDGTQSFNTNTSLTLWDKYLNIKQNIKDTSMYIFTVTSDVNTKGKNRFSILVNTASDILSTSVDTLYMTSQSGDYKTITLTSNINVGMYISSDWYNASANIINANTTILGITTSQSNENTYPKFNTITLAGNGLVKTIVIKQAGAQPTLQLSDTALYIGAKANEKVLNSVVSNTNWQISNISSWIAVSPTQGYGNAVLTITAITDNPSNFNDVLTYRSGGFAISATGINKHMQLLQNYLSITRDTVIVVVTTPGTVTTVTSYITTTTTSEVLTVTNLNVVTITTQEVVSIPGATITLLGMNEMNSNGVIISPNPNDGRAINVSVRKSGNYQIILYNARAEKVKQQSAYILDNKPTTLYFEPNLVKGLYIMHITDDDKNKQTGKIIVE